jgi:murein DD-endopeptidase MepM/ murein hydrolase activator NlpD
VNRVILALAGVIPVAAAPAPSQLRLNGSPTQGGLVVAALPPGTGNLTLDNRPVMIGADGNFVIGFGRDAAASAELAWRSADGTLGTRIIAVAARHWRVESLPTLPLRPVPDAEFDTRRPGELQQIAAARAAPSALDDWQRGFHAPVEGRISGEFGSQRILSGQPQAPHSGIDFAVAAGTPVRAPAGGIVRLAAGPFTLEGNLVMIDHGFGVTSALLHLASIAVKPGDRVEEGQTIGTVGATGRATGPHLHWAMMWNGVRVDPGTALMTGHTIK